MIAPCPSRTAHRASVAMAGTGIAMLTHLADPTRPALISALIVASSLLAWFAAHEVRRDDPLGWTMAVGHALVTTATMVVLLTIGLPGLRIGGWTAPTVGTLGLSGAVLVAGVVAGRERIAGRRAGIADTVHRVG